MPDSPYFNIWITAPGYPSNGTLGKKEKSENEKNFTQMPDSPLLNTINSIVNFFLISISTFGSQLQVILQIH